MSAFDDAWSFMITKGTVDSIMDALYSPAISTQEQAERRNREVNEVLERIARDNGVTTADIHRLADLTGHPDDPSQAVYDDVNRRRAEWERQNGKTVWPGEYVTHMGIGPDPELMRIADEWEMNYDHPGGREYVGSLGLRRQIIDAMFDLSGHEYGMQG